METPNPANERCLTLDERRELQEQWVALQATLKQMGSYIEGPQDVDCDELYTLFLRLGDAFEGFERSVMRSKQIRLLHTTHGDHTA